MRSDARLSPLGLAIALEAAYQSHYAALGWPRHACLQRVAEWVRR